MTIAELIKQLQTFDPDLVMYTRDNEGRYYEAEDIDVHNFDKGGWVQYGVDGIKRGAVLG